MNFQTAAKAVELKNLIDNAHLYLPKIGRCVSLEVEFKREYLIPEDEMYDDDYDDDDDDDYDDDDDDDKEEERQRTKTRTLEKIQDKLTRIYDLQGFRMEESGFKDGTIKVLGEEIQSLCSISLEDIEKWYALGKNSGFGNMMKQETQHNAQVRSSRELDASQFTVSEQILDEVAMKWGEEFIPRSLNLICNEKTLSIWGQRLIPHSVTVQPYKIVIYGPGDHFQFHKDTPEENLCGTFLISLYGDCEPSSAFEIRWQGKSFKWSGRGWCAFYPDIPHRVEVLQSGYRAILSFKIYARDQEGLQEWSTNAAAKMEMESLVKELQNLDVSVGILLSHHYGYDSKSIYGCDKLLLDTLKEKGLGVDLKPVLVRFFGEGRDPGDDNSYRRSYYPSASYKQGSMRSSVYSITDEALEYVRQRLTGTAAEENFAGSSKEIVFLDGETKNDEGLWDFVTQQEIEYTGNESQPHSENSVYVRYAAIVQPADTASQTE